MSVVPVVWANVPEWMRKVANAINPLVRNWPNFSTPGTIGHETGAGGTVTQATSKATGVTLSKACGQITLNNASLAANAAVSFTLTNTLVTAGDRLILSHDSGGTLGAYSFNGACAAGSATMTVRNLTAGALAEAVVIGFTLIKGVTS